MTSKGTKETIATKLGFKSSSSASKAEVELERVRKENAHLRRKMDEVARRHIKPPDADKSKLLERILSLEMMRERNNQQLLVKEQDLETLRKQLSARGGEVVASLQAQLEQRRNEAVQRDRLFQTISEETQNLKNKLAVLESQQMQAVNCQVPPGDLAMVQDQLRDALEKNQQWMVYDQQRETYVQSVVTRTVELEQQLAQAQQQQQPQHEPTSDAKSAMLEVQKDLEAQREQVLKAQKELQVQKEQTSRAQAALQSQKEQVTRLQEEVSALQRRHEDTCRELSTFQRKYGEKSTQLEEVKEQLQAERANNRHVVSEQRMVSSELADRMDVRLEEERKRSAELLQQVNQLQKSLLSQSQEQRRMVAVEQQIQLSAKDFEDEKIDRQTMQHQLHKVLKELRKARDQITRLESAKQPNSRFSEPSSYAKLAIGYSPGPTSPSKVTNLLDESFLECPKCRTPYATSQHRELLAHIDYCFA